MSDVPLYDVVPGRGCLHALQRGALALERQDARPRRRGRMTNQIQPPNFESLTPNMHMCVK